MFYDLFRLGLGDISRVFMKIQRHFKKLVFLTSLQTRIVVVIWPNVEFRPSKQTRAKSL